MKPLVRISLFVVLSTLWILFSMACSTVPITGRQQLDLIPKPTMLSMSFQQYDSFIKDHTLSKNQQQSQVVKSVGQNIQKAVEQYMAMNNMSSLLNGYAWEFNLVENEEANAWCMPGGKVVVYTGILAVTQDEIGLAVVMGHEIAHAIARHGDERMSQGLLTQLGGLAFSVALQEKPEATRQLWMQAFGLGTELGILLPYSRLHESEADHLGLIFMAMAGYDPHAAVAFWQRMADKKTGPSLPEFLSSHPADQTRIRQIMAETPEAMKYFKNR